LELQERLDAGVIEEGRNTLGPNVKTVAMSKDQSTERTAGESAKRRTNLQKRRLPLGPSSATGRDVSEHLSSVEQLEATGHGRKRVIKGECSIRGNKKKGAELKKGGRTSYGI